MKPSSGMRKTPSWIFVGAQPSSGSTLLARLLTSVPGFTGIEDRCEGQWLTPQLYNGETRWNPPVPENFDEIRPIWLEACRTRARNARVVVEKSPPNLCRMHRLMEAFSEFPQSLVLLTRHPLAICASWSQRYPPEVVQCNWCPYGRVDLPDAAAYFRFLGKICGERFAMQADLHEVSDIWISYEDLTSDPETVLGSVLDASKVRERREPIGAPIGDFADRNRGLIETLSTSARASIVEGLAPYAGALERFGYRIE
ncbi:sulfotransferase [Roseibium sp. MMSF_3544]|uniref:sulfotransferase family protein n=1 Tax=unclassified Roseibium TaxID=2629323 RepID=UPI00273E7385|nr:sulfotransferase [Roseibium sp. MMSF_3544]